jgi:hypothetical protein
MAREISGFAMAPERLTHDLTSRPVQRTREISSAFDNVGAQGAAATYRGIIVTTEFLPSGAPASERE